MEANTYQLWEGNNPTTGDRPELTDAGLHMIALAKNPAPANETDGTDLPTGSNLPSGETPLALTDNSQVQIAAGTFGPTATSDTAYGCSLQSAADGLYTIQLNPAFTKAPAVIATIDENQEEPTASNVRVAQIQSVSTNTVVVQITGATREKTSAKFHLLAIGEGTSPASDPRIVYGIVDRDGARRAGDGILSSENGWDTSYNDARFHFIAYAPR